MELAIIFAGLFIGICLLLAVDKLSHSLNKIAYELSELTRKK
jgi:hypothetical protein